MISSMKGGRILVVTTVPITLRTILRDQPRFLAGAFDVALATSPDDGWQEIAAEEGVEVHPVAMHRGISPVFDLFSVLGMIGVIRRFRPDVIHSYTPKAGLVAMLAGWICRVDVRIHTFTGLIFPSQAGMKKKLLLWVDSLICALATRVVPEGEGVKCDLRAFQVTRKQLDVIGFGNIAGVDTAFFSLGARGVAADAVTLKRRFGISGDDFVFCFVGRLHKDKGISELLVAFLQQDARSRLVIVGNEDDTAPISESERRTVQSHDRIHWLGFQQDIRPALAVSDVLVLPSYREGFPNAVLQAGAMELPVIATDISGCNEVVEPGFNGWLVPIRDALSLRNAMLDAFDAPPEKREEMGRRARARIQSRFERQHHWQRLVDFYRRELASC